MPVLDKAGFKIMFKNFIDANDESVANKLKASVCIIGAGAAGITLANNLAGVDDVLLIESGDFEIDGRTQALYSGSNIGLPYFDLLGCRLRYFGGTTNHWGGYCRPNDPIDYEGRDEVSLPKWPIDEKNLSPYINKAAKELGLSTEFYNAELLLAAKGAPTDELLENVSSDFYTKVFQGTKKLRFSQIYRDKLSKQNNLRVCLNLNAIHVQLTPDASRVSSIRCKTLNGKVITVEAKEFVLASHAIENARLMLNSNDIQQKGVGNQYDHVGRYFMDHAHISASKLIPSDKFPGIYNSVASRRFDLNANLSFTDDYLRKNHILQYYCRFNPVYTVEKVVDSLRGVKSNIMEPFSEELFNDIKTVVNNLEGSVNFLSARYGVSQPLPKYYSLEHRIEQAPNPDSRVVISKTKDALGVPQADLQWKLNEHDYRTFRVGHEKVIKELSALGMGRFITEEITPELVDERIAGHYHHIGTTKMSAYPSDGVVDQDCKVHNLSNLYVAGSSIFPTAGYSGPTMMIVAFAIRLAEHISEKIKS